MDGNLKAALALGAFVCAGLVGAAYIGGSSAIKFKEYERTVSVKGLSEREVPADVAVWPIGFTGASADLTTLYATMERNSKRIVDYLESRGFEASEITIVPPAVTDKLAQQWDSGEKVQLRYRASQTITVYSSKVDLVRSSMTGIVDLGKEGIAFTGSEAQQPEFIFTKLNELKPAMVEEATRAAREVAQKFASDSHSRLGKIKDANQGQFSVENRDSSSPHIKSIRVVSTVEYYLSD
jgi:Uncharacterized protein conserved in bacteria